MFRVNKLISLSLFISPSLLSSLASADDLSLEQMKREIDQLKQQLVSQQKVIGKLETMLTKNNIAQKQIATKVETLAKTPPATANGGVVTTMIPTPSFASSDGKYTFTPIGRIHADYASFDDDKTDHPDSATIRSMRLGFKGSVDKDIKYKAELDFGNKDGDDSPTFKDVYVAYTGYKPVQMRIGSFKPAYGLEELIRPSHTTFIERSLPTTTFASSEILGIQAYSYGEHYTWALGLHNDRSTTKSADDEAHSVVSRVTVAPIVNKTDVVHFGGSFAYRTPDQSAQKAVFATTAENALQTKSTVNTGDITGVDNIQLAGLEAAAVHKNLSLQGEYFHTDVNSSANADNSFSGWYSQASWIVTGESRPYNKTKGLFTYVRPKNSFNPKEGKWGAVELAARYSEVDLNDGVVTGGKAQDTTLGVNWYLNNNLRMMGNYIMVDRDNVTIPGANVAAGDDPRIILFRTQIDF